MIRYRALFSWRTIVPVRASITTSISCFRFTIWSSQTAGVPSCCCIAAPTARIGDTSRVNGAICSASWQIKQETVLTQTSRMVAFSVYCTSLRKLEAHLCKMHYKETSKNNDCSYRQNECYHLHFMLVKWINKK